MAKKNPGLSEYILPAAMYGLKDDTLVLDCWLHLIANKGVSEGMVYDITKVLVENIGTLREFSKGTQNLTAQEMATDVGIPFHEGALKYYREKKLAR